MLTVLTAGLGTVTPNLNAHDLKLGQTYTVTAIPAEGQDFAGWTGGISSPSSKLTFTLTPNLVLTANFIPRATASAALAPASTVNTTYNGLFHQDDEVRLTTSGSFTLTVTPRGKYSGRVQLGTKRYSFSGLLDSQKTGGTNLISRKDGATLTFGFQISSQADQVTGYLTDGTWTSTLSGDRAVFGKANPAPFLGTYTMVIPGYDNTPSLPAGDGFGTLKVDIAGQVKFVGFDASAKLVEALQKGEIAALVVQNPVRMGYLGVKTMVAHLRGEKVEKRVDTGVGVATPENMKEPEIAGLLSPDFKKWLQE